MKNTCIKWLRENLNLTQRQFADKLGTRQQIIGMVENNKRNVPKSVIHALYTEYNIHYEEIRNCKSRQELLNILNSNTDNKYIIHMAVSVNRGNRAEVLNKIISFTNEIGQLSKLEIEDIKWGKHYGRPQNHI